LRHSAGHEGWPADFETFQLQEGAQGFEFLRLQFSAASNGLNSFPLLYEINTRSWLAELSAKSGRQLTLANVPDAEFEFWQCYGFTHLWLMGVWATGECGRVHSVRELFERGDLTQSSVVIGSPYAITGYTVSARLGGDEALVEFRRRLNERGLKLILDFIPNHTAIDHPWVTQHPEFYATSHLAVPHAIRLNSSGPWFAHGYSGFDRPWVDTLQLDYRNPALRRAMMDELLAISAKCDGVRCDMAMLALNDVFARTWREYSNPHPPIETEFWTDAIATVRNERKDFLFLAEVYWDLEARLQELGFDFTYDKRLYDRIVSGTGMEVIAYLYSLSETFMARSAHFLENHDEARIASLLSPMEQRGAALLIMSLPGMRLLHEGQMHGRRVRANIHVETRPPEKADPEIESFYERLFQALRRTAIGVGDVRLLRTQAACVDNPTHQHIVVIQWQCEPHAFDLVVVNLSDVQSQYYAPLHIEGLAQSRWRFTDLLGHEVHDRDGLELSQRGLYLDVAPHAAQLFHVEIC
jgi:hypothetical protein